MVAFVSGPLGQRVLRAAVLPAVVALLAISQGGCAQTNGAYAANASDVAVNTAPSRYVEMEADGLPVQAAPLPRARNAEDDPAQPFSRNYGGPNPAALSKPSIKQVSDATSVPAGMPAGVRRLADASRNSAY